MLDILRRRFPGTPRDRFYIVLLILALATAFTIVPWPMNVAQAVVAIAGMVFFLATGPKPGIRR